MAEIKADGKSVIRDLTPREVEALPDESFALIDGEGRRYLHFADTDGKIMRDEARRALNYINSNLVPGVDRTQKTDAFTKVVDALQKEDLTFKPPPRRF